MQLFKRIMAATYAFFMITITNFQAGPGDTFLVDVQPAGKEPVALLIDCGYHFNARVLPVLRQMGAAGRKLNRLIITHYDADHIAGAYDFLLKNGSANAPQIIPIDQVYLNSFRHLQFSKRSSEPLSQDEKSKLTALKSELSFSFAPREKEISARQAMLLGRLLFKLGYPWNNDLAGGAIKTGKKPIPIGSDVSLLVLSPTIDKLKLTEKYFIAQLARYNFTIHEDQVFDEAFELYMLREGKERRTETLISANQKQINANWIDHINSFAIYYKDKGIGNGSSISFILQTPEHQLLFLADAHAEDIMMSLEDHYENESRLPLIFDAIKVSHHGSFRNNKPELFDLIDSSRFIFSTDGGQRFGRHPDPETIAYIIKRPLPPQISCRSLYFNYDLQHLDGFKNAELMNKYNYEIQFELNIQI